MSQDVACPPFLLPWPSRTIYADKSKENGYPPSQLVGVFLLTGLVFRFRESQVMTWAR